MRRISTILILFFCIELIYGQGMKVQTAFNSLMNYKSEKNIEQIEKGRLAIDTAITNEKTSTKAKTWFYRGVIYYIIDTLLEKHPNPNWSANALNISFESFAKAKELDPSFSSLELIPIMNADIGITAVSDRYFMKGLNFYNKQDYNNAVNNFEKSIKIYETTGKFDTISVYDAALAAEKSKQFDKAKEFYTKLINLNIKQISPGSSFLPAFPRMYISLSDILFNNYKDTITANEILKKGREMFPDNYQLILSEINFYLNIGKIEEVKSKLDLAIQKEPDNASLYYVKANIYNVSLTDELYVKNKDKYNENFSKAEELYLKSIKLKPTYFEPNYNLGALYVNKGVAIIGYANTIDLNDPRYNDEKKKADEFFIKAIPYVKQAHDLNPKDKDTLKTLKMLYYRTKQMDKMKEVQEELDKL